MQVDPSPGMQSLPLRQNSAATILCCNCGASIDGTSAIGALCPDCFKLSVDITDGIQREGTLYLCRDCDRWQSMPNQWVVGQLESKELLALCLRQLRGLSKVRMTDARFLWTEPHSRRIKVKITIQQEAEAGAIVQQAFEVEYVVAYRQCRDCAKSYTHHTWRACVQVRQKVLHKRTFLYLEQLILKHGAHRNTMNMKEVNDGIDFFFADRNHADHFIDFLASVAPVRTKKSRELISMNDHGNKKNYKFTFSVELVPICKDDLVALPLKLAQQIGNIAPLCLCYRVSTCINLLDPNTLQTAEIPAPVFWRSPFPSLADVQELVEFIVMDIEPVGPAKGRFVLAEVTVARATDLGVNNTTYFTRTHLGAFLHAGDSVLGYHLTGTNFNSSYLEAIEHSKQFRDKIPDVMLVKKFYPRSKKKKNRNWRLKRMGAESEEEASKGRGRQVQDQMENDFEMFLRDVEEDEELRAGLSLYKADQRPRQQQAMDSVATEVVSEMDADEADNGLEIPMDQLLDEMEGMEIEDA